MEPDPETIEEFRQIYRKDFGEDLSLEDARSMWIRVMDLTLLLFEKPRVETPAKAASRSNESPVLLP